MQSLALTGASRQLSSTTFCAGFTPTISTSISSSTCSAASIYSEASCAASLSCCAAAAFYRRPDSGSGSGRVGKRFYWLLCFCFCCYRLTDSLKRRTRFRSSSLFGGEASEDGPTGSPPFSYGRCAAEAEEVNLLASRAAVTA